MGGLKIVSGLSLKKECYLNERKSEIKRNIIMVEITQINDHGASAKVMKLPAASNEVLKEI